MKTLVGINTLTSVGRPAYSNHCQIWYRLGRMTQDQFMMFHPHRMSIDGMRNSAAKFAMEQECDYLLFIDDDVLVPVQEKPDWYNKLKDADKDIVAGVTLIRSYPYHPMIFDWNNKDTAFHIIDYKERADGNGLLPCDAVGFSLCLIKVDLLKKMEPPFFVTGINHTEDVYFCQRAKIYVPDVSIYVDSTIETAHMLDPEPIMPSTLEAKMRYDEEIDPSLKDEKTGDHDLAYVQEVKDSLNADDRT